MNPFFYVLSRGRSGVQSLFVPSLARRLMLALLGAFMLVAVALLAKGFYEYKQEIGEHQALRQGGESLVRMLENIDDAALAGKMLRTVDENSNKARREEELKLDPLFLQLFDRKNNRLVYSSANAPQSLLPFRGIPVFQHQIQGSAYWIYASDGARWSFRLGEPELKDSIVARFIAFSLSPDLLLSFPLVFFPVWFAIHRGLHPLRRLARHLHGRDPSDLSPIDVDLRYKELKPVLESFESLLARLRHKVMQEQAFVQDAAHELRTPMAVIGAQAHVLTVAESPLDRKEAKQALDRAIARASPRSPQLLSLASLERGERALEVEIDLAGFTQSILAQFAPLAISKQIELVLEAPESLLWVTRVEPFQSILQNLIDNALRYGRPGGTVVVELSGGEQGLRLKVADDGPGIPLAEREQVFERFYRASGQEIPGTGLGLAIVKKATMNLGGDVSLEDGLNGQGIAFVVELPSRSRT